MSKQLKLPQGGTGEKSYENWAAEIRRTEFIVPSDFQFKSWDPTYAIAAGSTITGITTLTADYLHLGNLVWWSLRFSFASGAGPLNEVRATLPLPALGPPDTVRSERVSFAGVVEEATPGPLFFLQGGIYGLQTVVIQKNAAANFAAGISPICSGQGFYLADG